MGKIFKPNVSDFKLLIGTKEWTNVKAELGIDENSQDQEDNVQFDEDDFEVEKIDAIKMRRKEDSASLDGDSASAGAGSSKAGSYKPAFGLSPRDQSYSVFENPNQSSASQLALKTVM